MELKQQQGLDSLKQLWQWWIAELGQVMPRRVKEYFSAQTGMLNILLEQGVARFLLNTDKKQQLLGVIDLESATDAELDTMKISVLADIPAGVTVEVHISQDKLLVTSAYLPLATESNISSVLGFEIDRLTPFRADQASYSFEVVARHPEHEKIQLQLYSLPKQRLDKLLSRLKSLGLAPDAIWPDRGEDAAPAASLNLLPGELRPHVESIWNQQTYQLGLAALFLMGAVLLFPLYQFSHQIASLEKEIADIRQQALVVGDKQSLLASRLAAQDTLVLRKNTAATKLELVHQITQLLPDNTWVSRLKIEQGDISLQGESRKASDLIELLEKSEQFQNAAFASPITRNASTNMERYEIHMDAGEQK